MLPNVEEIDEKNGIDSSGVCAVAWWRCAAATALGAKDAQM
jgi:hypothetical protein